jgi:hypothetical protein
MPLDSEEPETQPAGASCKERVFAALPSGLGALIVAAMALSTVDARGEGARGAGGGEKEGDPDVATPVAAPALAPPDPSLDGGAPVLTPHAPRHPANAPRPAPTDATDYFRRRYEPAGFPLIGGDTDIGFEFGVTGTLSYFADGVKPYRWNMDLVLAASVKQGPTGPELEQQTYLWNFDVPALFGGGVRLNPEVSYVHTINYGYFGLGDASSGVVPTSAVNPARYHQWIESIAQVRTEARLALAGPFGALFALQYLYVNPTAYAGSLLADDSAARTIGGGPPLYGTTALSLPSLATGFLYDTRDDEIFAHSGMFDELGVRFEEGFPTGANVRYAEAGAILRGFVPIGPFVVAGRLVLNAQYGDVPFYDLFQAGPFDQQEMPGGSAGIRGVPVGRYLGPIKVIGNVELRAMWLRFSVLKQKFTIGDDLFFDTGRVWSDYSFHSPLDGHGAGLKYGVGGGIYALWGQAAMLRIEMAYSPDAVSENPTLPVGIYVEDGTMF